MLRKIVQVCLLVAACCIPVAGAEVKPMIGVYYFPGWHGKTGGEWKSAIMNAAKPRALSGFADDSNPALWGYFNRWMSSHGIDFIAFDWYYNDEQEFLNDALDKGFLCSANNTDLKYCLHWCNHGGPWWERKVDQTPPKLEKMIDLASEKHFKRPNYLRIDGKPVFMIYLDDMLGDARTALATIRKQAQKHGYPGVYLVSVYSASDRSEIQRRKNEGYDAFCAYTYCWMRGPQISWQSKTFDYKGITDNIVQNVHPYLARVAKEEGFVYWPSTFSGWDDRPRAGLENALVLTNNTPDQFGRMFRSGLNYVNPASPVVMVEAWNEWGEGACIEPSEEHGFGYLSEIAKALGISKTDERLPSKKEISSWCVLTPVELKIAKENESKPWPVKPIIYNRMGKSQEIPPVKLPFVLDFSDGRLRFATNDIKIDGRDEDGPQITTTGGDPQISVIIPKTPTGQIKRITLDADISAPAGQKLSPPEIYVATALLPDYTPFAAFPMPPIKDGKSTMLTRDVMSWESCGTPLTMIRIDPCSEPGAKFHLRRLILEGD